MDWRLPSAVWSAPSSPGGLALFLASRRAVSCQGAMRGLGITCVLDLSSEGGNVACVASEDDLRARVRDMEVDAPRLMSALPEALLFLAAKLKFGKRVVVHGTHGWSRSGSEVLAWLMMVNGSTYSQALSETRRHRMIVEPNPGFQAALQALDRRDLQAWTEQCEL